MRFSVFTNLTLVSFSQMTVVTEAGTVEEVVGTVEVDMVVGDALVAFAMTGRRETASVVIHAVLVMKMVELVVVMGATAGIASVVAAEAITGMMAMEMAEAIIDPVVCATSSRMAPAVMEMRVNSLMRVGEEVRVVEEVRVGDMVLEREEAVGVEVEVPLGYATNGKLETVAMVTLVDLPTLNNMADQTVFCFLLKYPACLYCSKKIHLYMNEIKP